MKRIFFFALLLAVVCIGGTPSILAAIDFHFSDRPVPVADEGTIETAEEFYRQGDLEQALTLLRGFVVQHPDSPLLNEAYLAMARIFLDRGHHLEALLYLDRIPTAQQGPAVRLVEGAALIAAGAIDEGSERLLNLDASSLSDADQVRRFAALGAAGARKGELLEALAFYHQAVGLAKGRERDHLLSQVHRLLTEELSDAELAEAAFMFGAGAIGQDAALQLAVRAFEAGEEERARQRVDEVVRSPVSFPYRDEAVALWEQLTGGVWLKRAVGVMLPMTGRYSSFGNLVRRGMELAQQIHNGGDDPVRFIFVDTGGDPGRSAQLVSELANRERVMAITGPLTGATAAAAAEKAQQERVPLLTLSQRQGLPETGEFVFRNSLTARLQARALARYAVEEQGMSAFGVLYPENRLGRELTELFAEEVLKRGGLVVTRESYDEKATDFGRQIRLLKGEDPDAPEADTESLRGEELLEDLFRPDEPDFPPVDFDALFIPDYAERIALIAPQLAYYGIEDVPLLGINGWNSPELIRAGGKYVEDAVFVDGFYRYSTYPFVQEFVNRYFEQYGEEPTIMEAQGFDAANILIGLINKSDVVTREGLRRELSRLENYPGVTGATSFDPQGDADKVLFLLQVQNGNIVQIN